MPVGKAKVMIEAEKNNDTLQEVERPIRTHEYCIRDVPQEQPALSPYGPTMSNRSHHPDYLCQERSGLPQFARGEIIGDNNKRKLRTQSRTIKGEKSLVRLGGFCVILVILALQVHQTCTGRPRKWIKPRQRSITAESSGHLGLDLRDVDAGLGLCSMITRSMIARVLTRLCTSIVGKWDPTAPGVVCGTVGNTMLMS